jgi:hypothetical protein
MDTQNGLVLYESLKLHSYWIHSNFALTYVVYKNIMGQMIN